MVLLEIRNLTKRFGALAAVQNVNLSVPAGEIFGLLGPNGAGKTTTVSIVCGLLSPTEGDVTVDGHSVLREPMAVRREVGVVPQELALYGALSGRENLVFFGRMQEIPARLLQERVRAVLDIVGLTDRQNDRVETYSGGMKRRLNVAIGLLNQPRLLILDEPTVGVDPQSRNNILETLRELNRQGVTMLYTSHYMEEVEFLCSHIAIMDHGRVIADGSQEELQRRAGGQDIISVRLGDEADEALRTRLMALPGVETVELQDHAVRIATASGRALVAPLVAELAAAGTTVTAIEVKEPNLEDLFLSLTGTSLRD
ncbi:MAG TPA: ABC transporter ATP-binding protein [Candidatus Cryosericum sp.]|nr:ABC transporter ATP-binding protein [Candidatus Cryosericum sp.]